MLSFNISPFPWIVAVVVFVVVAGNLDFGFISIFITSSILIFSTAILTLARPKPVMVEESVTEEGFPQEDEVLSDSKQRRLQSETIAQKRCAKEEEVVLEQKHSEKEIKKHVQEEAQEAQSNGYLIRSPEGVVWESESQYRSSSSEDSEVGWPFRESAGGHSSDGSISDEESLIEIAIPSGHYFVPKEEEEEEVEEEKDAKFTTCEQKKWGGLSCGTRFEQHSLMELLSEMNEEENLIEIDISMGSIKCSRVKMEA